MRLRVYFFGLERNDKEKDEILDRFIQKSKSTFTPSVGRDESRDLYIELVKNDDFSNMKSVDSLICQRQRMMHFMSYCTTTISLYPGIQGVRNSSYGHREVHGVTSGGSRKERFIPENRRRS